MRKKALNTIVNRHDRGLLIEREIAKKRTKRLDRKTAQNQAAKGVVLRPSERLNIVVIVEADEL